MCTIASWSADPIKRGVNAGFVGFQKAFDMVPCSQLMTWLETLAASMDVQWGIYALYKSMSGKVGSPIGCWKL